MALVIPFPVPSKTWKKLDEIANMLREYMMAIQNNQIYFQFFRDSFACMCLYILF
jgi:hypothetical protein